MQKFDIHQQITDKIVAIMTRCQCVAPLAPNRRLFDHPEECTHGERL